MGHGEAPQELSASYFVERAAAEAKAAQQALQAGGASHEQIDVIGRVCEDLRELRQHLAAQRHLYPKSVDLLALEQARGRPFGYNPDRGFSNFLNVGRFPEEHGDCRHEQRRLLEEVKSRILSNLGFITVECVVCGDILMRMIRPEAKGIDRHVVKGYNDIDVFIGADDDANDEEDNLRRELQGRKPLSEAFRFVAPTMRLHDADKCPSMEHCCEWCGTNNCSCAG